MGRKITIEPVTRIEGHANVTIHLDDSGKVENAYLHVNQYRGFEKFSEGRLHFEMPEITPRICGICPVSHHLASAKACDAIIGVQPPRQAQLLRALMHKGQMIQSHSMHFFMLAGPDLLLGWDADPAIRNVFGIIQANPDLAVKAIKLRKFGQEIIQILGDKKVHPHFAVPGGVNKALSVKERDYILGQLDEMISYVQEGIAVAKAWMADNQALIDRFAVFSSGYMGMVLDDGGLNLYDGKLRMIDADGNRLEEFEGKDYLKYIGEHVEDWSYLKFPFYLKKGWPDGVYRVGPLGRLNAADSIPTPLAQEEFLQFKGLNGGRPTEGTLYFHYARLIEDLYSMERARELLEDPDILSTDIVATPKEIAGEGVGVIEAPRGTLFHHYWTDDQGVITKVNLIVATGHNNWAMSKSVEEVAKEFVDGRNLTEGMLNRVEAAIRAYDPCLSCSTHAFGQMPLEITLYDAQNHQLDRMVR